MDTVGNSKAIADCRSQIAELRPEIVSAIAVYISYGVFSGNEL